MQFSIKIYNFIISLVFYRYDDCRLHYSDQSFFYIVDDTVTFSLCSNENISNPHEFNRALEVLLQDLAARAAFDASMYATGDANVNSTQKIYGSVQCTKDLAPNDCNRCLQRTYENIKQCCFGKQGGSILGTSCNVRFELYPFFEVSRLPPPPPSTGNDDTCKLPMFSVHKIFSLNNSCLENFEFVRDLTLKFLKS